jgi:hypothetical protein
LWCQAETRDYFFTQTIDEALLNNYKNVIPILSDNIGLSLLTMLVVHLKTTNEYKATYRFFLKNKNLGIATRRYLKALLEVDKLSLPLTEKQLNGIPHFLDIPSGSEKHELYLKLINEPTSLTEVESNYLYYVCLKFRKKILN